MVMIRRALPLLAALVLVGMLLAIVVAVWRTPGGWLVVTVTVIASGCGTTVGALLNARARRALLEEVRASTLATIRVVGRTPPPPSANELGVGPSTMTPEFRRDFDAWKRERR